jgi:phage portal protein BeeE
VPGGVVQVKDAWKDVAAGVTQATQQKIKSAFRDKFTGKGRGDVAVLEPGFEWIQMGLPLKDLDLALSRATPEARACALHLIPPEVVGLNVGMEHSTENNLAESRVRWVNSTLIPLWIQNGKKISAGLRNDFPGVDIRYNINTVRALQEQRQQWLANQADALLAWVQGFSSGKIDPNAAREGAVFLFGLTDEQASKIFPKTPQISRQAVDASGALVEDDE